MEEEEEEVSRMSEHFYDNCNGGICLKCDRCRNSACCSQEQECDGRNWEFLTKPALLRLARDLHKDVTQEL